MGPTCENHFTGALPVCPPATPVVNAAACNREWREALFLRSLNTINLLCRETARRGRMGPDETDDFTSAVKLRIIANDYEVLRKFRGQSNLKAYLRVVIQRMLLDQRNSAWGRWRASAGARRAGPVAITLERMTVRDGLSFDDAQARLQRIDGHRHDTSALQNYLANFAPRLRQRRMEESVTHDLPHPSPSPFDEIARLDSIAATERASKALRSALAKLSAEDRRLIKLRYGSGTSTADIARELRLDQKALYRRFERLLRYLRSQLESAGVNRENLAVGA